MTPLQRRCALYGTLALALLVSYFGVRAQPNQPAHAIVAPVERKPVPAAPVAPVAVPDVLPLDKLERAGMLASEGDPFGVKNWVAAPVAPPPPMQAAPVAPPAAPVAPAMPFSFAGKVEETSGNWVVYLAKGDDSFAVKKGDVFAMDYRFDGIENGNAIIQYLPVPTRHTLSVGTNE